jgi:hypothetical protein
MLRTTASVLLVGGVTLLVTWGVRPAESQAPRTPARVSPDVLPPLPAELDEIDLEVERLSARLDRRSTFDLPDRDPFNFVSRARVLRAPAPDVEPLALPAEIVRPDWPSLVAIMARTEGAGLEVALTDRAGDLHVVSAGAALGSFVVTEVTADVVTITDQSSGQTTRLTVR